MSSAHSPTFLSLHLHHSSFSNPSITLTYVTVHSPTHPLLLLCHISFSNPSVASPMSQFILQLFHCFSYVTAHSPTLPPLYQHHSSFYSPSVASPTSYTLHLRHLVSCPCPYDDDYIHDDFVICNDCSPQDYMKDLNCPSNSKG